jgi:uncharacterized damage-inducible protein DinB
METSSKDTILEFIHYNNWANVRILKACQELTEEQLSASAPGTYGTVRATLEHIIRSEAGYLALLNGAQSRPAFQWQDQPSI